MFAQYNTANLSSPGESFALTDLLGSVRAIQPIDHTSDEFSAPFADAPVFAEYDAWGNTVWKDAQVRPEATLANGQTTDWTGRDSLFSWTGREYEPISGLQWNRARWYDPQVGRWLSDDPIGFAAGDTNLQRYVGNSPTNATDPSGLKGECSVSERDHFSDLYGTDSELTREQEEAYNSASFGKTPSQIRAEASRAGRAVLGDHLSDEEAESLVYFARHGGFFNDPAFWAMSPAQRRGAIEAFRGRMEDRLRQLEYDRKQPTVGMATPADIRRGEELRLQREAEKARQSGSRMRQMHADMALAKHRGESTFVAGMSHLAGAAVDCACAASAIRRNAKPTSRSLARSPK